MTTTGTAVDYYYAGAPCHPGTTLPANVTGECDHKHRTGRSAQKCIAELDRAIKRGHGQAAYCDRQVMAILVDGSRVTGTVLDDEVTP